MFVLGLDSSILLSYFKNSKHSANNSVSLNNLLDAILPAQLKKDRVLRITFKMTLGIILVVSLSGIIYSSLYFYFGHYVGGIVIISGVVLCFSCLLQLRLSIPLNIIGNELVIMMFCIQVLLSVTSGGVLVPNTMWFATVPVLAVVLNGINSGIQWSILSSLFVVILFIGSLAGYSFPKFVEFETQELEIFQGIASAGLVFFVAAFYMVFEKIRQKAVIESEELRVKAEESAQALKAATDQLVESAHRAGMADIASGTLHNVGNLLNSVKTSLYTIKSNVNQSYLDDFKKANRYLADNFDDLTPKKENQGSVKDGIVRYYRLLEQKVIENLDLVVEELNRLTDKINAISDVVASQQRFVGFGGMTEEHSLESLVRDVLAIESPNIESLGIKVELNFAELPKIQIQKTKLLHILINLLKNAEEALIMKEKFERNLRISLQRDRENVLIEVSDNGCGISKENQKKIFTHGFTTKEDGYGFGLHSCALYVEDMQGRIWVESEGSGNGTSFFLSIPIAV